MDRLHLPTAKYDDDFVLWFEEQITQRQPEPRSARAGIRGRAVNPYSLQQLLSHDFIP